MSAKKTKLDNIQTATGQTSPSEEKAEATVSKEKLDTLSYADGKEEEKIQKAKDLEKLVGLEQVNPFGTSITSVFEKKLEEMPLVDMQELAVTVGIFPSGTKTSLRNKLLKGFRDHQRGSSSFAVPSSVKLCPEADRDSSQFKKALKLMQEGL